MSFDLSTCPECGAPKPSVFEYCSERCEILMLRATIECLRASLAECIDDDGLYERGLEAHAAGEDSEEEREAISRADATVKRAQAALDASEKALGGGGK